MNINLGTSYLFVQKFEICCALVLDISFRLFALVCPLAILLPAFFFLFVIVIVSKLIIVFLGNGLTIWKVSITWDGKVDNLRFIAAGSVSNNLHTP
jgi:hypothetical protein